MTESRIDPLRPFKVEGERGSWRGVCWSLIGEGGSACLHRTKKMGSEQKAETAIKDHLRDVHGVDL